MLWISRRVGCSSVRQCIPHLLIVVVVIAVANWMSFYYFSRFSKLSVATPLTALHPRSIVVLLSAPSASILDDQPYRHLYLQVVNLDEAAIAKPLQQLSVDGANSQFIVTYEHFTGVAYSKPSSKRPHQWFVYHATVVHYYFTLSFIVVSLSILYALHYLFGPFIAAIGLIVSGLIAATMSYSPVNGFFQLPMKVDRVYGHTLNYQHFVHMSSQGIDYVIQAFPLDYSNANVLYFNIFVNATRDLSHVEFLQPPQQAAFHKIWQTFNTELDQFGIYGRIAVDSEQQRIFVPITDERGDNITIYTFDVSQVNSSNSPVHLAHTLNYDPYHTKFISSLYYSTKRKTLFAANSVLQEPSRFLGAFELQIISVDPVSGQVIVIIERLPQIYNRFTCQETFREETGEWIFLCQSNSYGTITTWLVTANVDSATITDFIELKTSDAVMAIHHLEQ